LPYKPIKAILYAVLLWITGFVWGSVVFMTPSLHARPIPYISSNPAISFPILLVWLALSYLLAMNYLKAAADKAGEGLKLGLTFTLVNALLDLLVLVILLKAGLGYFVSLTVWIAYTMLIVVPLLTGRSLRRK
jgi:hypothetical protein